MEKETKMKIIVDIDGTLTKVGDRVNCILKKDPDWDSFYSRCSEDLPVDSVISIVIEARMAGYTIVLCSGRRESCRKDTEAWLERYGVPWDYMLLRKDGDTRHDMIVKPEMIAEEFGGFHDIRYVLEDRNSMVKAWRELGLLCLQVADGDF